MVLSLLNFKTFVGMDIRHNRNIMLAFPMDWQNVIAAEEDRLTMFKPSFLEVFSQLRLSHKHILTYKHILKAVANKRFIKHLQFHTIRFGLFSSYCRKLILAFCSCHLLINTKFLYWNITTFGLAINSVLNMHKLVQFLTRRVFCRHFTVASKVNVFWNHVKPSTWHEWWKPWYLTITLKPVNNGISARLTMPMAMTTPIYAFISSLSIGSHDPYDCGLLEPLFCS